MYGPIVSHEFIQRNSSKQQNSMAPFVAQRPTSFDQCVTRSNAGSLQPVYGLELRLGCFVLISELLCLLHRPITFELRQLIFHHHNLTDRGLNAILRVFDVALNSSTMFFHVRVYTRHLDTGYYRSHSPRDSHLNRHVLAAASLVWPVTLAHDLVHLGNASSSGTCLLHSTLLFNTEASSNQLLLFAD